MAESGVILLPVGQYRRSSYCEAIQFTSADPAHVQEIIDFVGLPISIDYEKDGRVKLRVIRGALDVVVAYTSDYIVKHADGRLETVKQADFEAEYEPVGSG